MPENLNKINSASMNINPDIKKDTIITIKETETNRIQYKSIYDTISKEDIKQVESSTCFNLGQEEHKLDKSIGLNLIKEEKASLDYRLKKVEQRHC